MRGLSPIHVSLSMLNTYCTVLASRKAPPPLPSSSSIPQEPATQARYIKNILKERKTLGTKNKNTTKSNSKRIKEKRKAEQRKKKQKRKKAKSDIFTNHNAFTCLPSLIQNVLTSMPLTLHFTGSNLDMIY